LVGFLEEWATWSSWRGSAGLVRHVAEKLVRSVSPDAKSTITVAVFDDEEVFDSPSTFASDVTADALRDFHRLTISVQDALISAEVIFARAKGANEVRFSVRWSNTKQTEQALTVARAVCVALRRGHRRWIGRTAGSTAIPVGWRGSSLPWPTGAAATARGLAGAAFTLLVLSTISTLFPKHPISETLGLLTAATAGIGSVWLLSELVPSIEIAEPGKTRFARASRWAGLTMIGLIVSQVAKKAFGS
jgi:hypothetical protein